MSGRQTDRIEQMTPESRRFPANMSFVGKEAYCFSADILPTGAEPPRNLGKNQLAELLDKLSDRDFEILISLKYAKYLLTGQIKRLHFSESPKPQVGMRSTTRNMFKLKEYGLVKTFERRIGGIRAGSASYIWCLTEPGQRLLDLRHGEYEPRRTRSHRYLEPSYVHIRHTLAIAECYVQLVEISRKYRKIVFTQVEWEPDCWRPFQHKGHDIQLKPDLFAVTYNDGYEDRWFIEIDLSTEAMTVVMDKCRRYHQYLNSGIEQRQHNGVFPITVWIVPDEQRKQKIIEAIKETFKKAPSMFAVITAEEFEELIRSGASDVTLY